VSARREDAVEPGLLVLVAGGCESCSREFFGVKTERWFLRRIAIRWKGSYNTVLDIA
jgi:hypothetical protein